MDRMESNHSSQVYVLPIHPQYVRACLCKYRLYRLYRLYDIELMLLLLCTFFSSLWDVSRIFLFLPFSIPISPSFLFYFVSSYEANARTHIYKRKYFYCVAKINCVGIFFDVTQDWTLNESFWHAINNTKRKANQNKRSEIMHDIVGYWLLNIHSLLLLLRLLLLLLLLLLNAVCGEYVHHYIAQISQFFCSIFYEKQETPPLPFFQSSGAWSDELSCCTLHALLLLLQINQNGMGDHGIIEAWNAIARYTWYEHTHMKEKIVNYTLFSIKCEYYWNFLRTKMCAVIDENITANHNHECQISSNGILHQLLPSFFRFAYSILSAY